MCKYINRIIVIALAALATSTAFCQTKATSAVPDFSLASIDGKSTITLSSFTDKPVLLVFWISSCPHCKKELPIVQKVYADLSEKGLNVIGINIDENPDTAADFVSKNKITFPNAFAGNEDGFAVIMAYSVPGVPALLILDTGGEPKAGYVGMASEQSIKEQLAKVGIK